MSDLTDFKNIPFSFNINETGGRCRLSPLDKGRFPRDAAKKVFFGDLMPMLPRNYVIRLIFAISYYIKLILATPAHPAGVNGTGYTARAAPRTMAVSRDGR